MSLKAFRASILHFPDATSNPGQDFQYFNDGLLVVDGSKIVALGDANSLLEVYLDVDLIDYSGKLLLPGFIDSHLHFPQTEMIASYGEQLLEWLENYTFPTERKFEDEVYAAQIAQVFLRQLHRHGTTSALVYSSVHKQAAEALFNAADKHNMALIAGKVCMDRHCPDWLQDTPESAARDSADLIDKWHGHNRCQYAITPRFAPTSSKAQMAALAEVAQQYPDVFIQSHLSENHNEIAWVKSLYPEHATYLEVYDHYGMVRPRSVYGHCIHLEASEWQLMADKGASIAFCPTSNLFLGSGLFDLQTAKDMKVPVTLATDVGGGTSFSMLHTQAEAYKVCQLRGYNLASLEGLYLMTQGSASALQLEHSIGNLNIGTEADFVVLDPMFDELTALRLKDSQHNPEDILFTLNILGDDRATYATWIAGSPVYQKNTEEETLNAVA